jgi:hypothetical protein
MWVAVLLIQSGVRRMQPYIVRVNDSDGEEETDHCACTMAEMVGIDLHD